MYTTEKQSAEVRQMINIQTDNNIVYHIMVSAKEGINFI